MKARIAVAATALFLVIGALIGIYVYMELYRVDMGTIEHIKQCQASPNEFNDPSNDIQVSSVDDIGYLVRGSYLIDIHYGRQIISMNKKCFESEEFRRGLKSIGIQVYTHVKEDTGDVLYKVTYWGDTVKEYSKVN